MRKSLFLLVFTLHLLACQKNQKPEFLYIENVRMTDYDLKTITVMADAVFDNKAVVGGTLTADNIRVYLNEDQVATLNSEAFNMPAKKRFNVPLTVHIPFKSVDRETKANLLKSILSGAATGSTELQFKGNIKYKILGFSSDYPINYSQKIVLH